MTLILSIFTDKNAYIPEYIRTIRFDPCSIFPDHSAILSAGVALLASLLFWLLYDLTPEMANAKKKKLEEIEL